MRDKTKELIDSILQWWEEHGYIFNHEPDFVTLAKQLKKDS